MSWWDTATDFAKGVGMANRLFQFTLRMLHEDGRPGGALVPCYAAAADYQDAVRQAVAALRKQGLRFDDVRGPVQEIDPAQWDRTVAATWPEFTADLPRQTDLSRIVAAGGAFFGPMAGFGAPEPEKAAVH